MVGPVDFEALYRRALVLLGAADTTDATTMPLALLSRMYGPRTLQRFRAAVCWIAMLLATRQLREIHVDDGAVRDKVRELTQLAAGWVVNHPTFTQHSQLVIRELHEGNLRFYYETLYFLQARLIGPVLAPTVGDSYAPQLIKRLFDLSVLLEFLNQQHGAGSFPPESSAEQVFSRWSHADIGQLTALLERIVAVQYTWVAAFPTYPLFERFNTLDGLLDRVLAYANAADPGTRRQLMIERGDLHISGERVWIA